MHLRRSIDTEIREGTSTLESAGILSPKRDALAIWASLENCRPGDVWLRREESASDAQCEVFREAVRRRAVGEPLPYVLGTVGFRQLEIKIDSRALIPRPETEGLVECVLDWSRQRAMEMNGGWGVAADIGTGSGCIALSLASEGAFERVVATDVSDEALALAGENLETVAPDTPIELRKGSLLAPVTDLDLDVIVSNPPYVAATEHANLDNSVSGFEPRGALVSSEGGMWHTRMLLEGANQHLVPGGLIAIEVDSTRAPAALDVAHRLGWKDARVEADLFDRPRFFLATKET